MDAPLGRLLKGLRWLGVRCADDRALVIAFSLLSLSLQACVPHKQFFSDPADYLTQLAPNTPSSIGVERAVIEFDEFGSFWDIGQLEDTLALIERRNREHPEGVAVYVFMHGWMNNADGSREDGDLRRFEEAMLARIDQIDANIESPPGHVIGVFLGWRGATNRVPLYWQLSFWDRRRAAERIASHDLRETLIRLAGTTNMRRSSAIIVAGHSLGASAVTQVLSPGLSALILAAGDSGVPLPFDLVFHFNPAISAVVSKQFIDMLKRFNVRLEIVHADGRVTEAPGPFVASITSTSDWVTSTAFAIGERLGKSRLAFREDTAPGEPSQWELATTAEGHADFLASHRAWVEDGSVRLERIPGAYNDTPAWIIQVSPEISRDHGDIRNPRFSELLDILAQMNRTYDSDRVLQIRVVPPSTDSAGGG
ncbi:MAG: hypothetical protein AAGI53_17000 [Planctomycetota bacterium]